MILDSTFLVDFEREMRRGKEGPATRFLQSNPDEPLMITFTIAGELAAGESLGRDRTTWEAFLAPFQVLGFTPDVAWQFGVIYRELRQAGMLIGANDMWIAATAKAFGVSLVTRNADDFDRVSGLSVKRY